MAISGLVYVNAASDILFRLLFVMNHHKPSDIDPTDNMSCIAAELPFSLH